MTAALGWHIDPSSAALRQLALAITTLRTVGLDASTSTLSGYGQAVFGVAEREVAAIPTASQADAVRYVVAGTVFYEPVLLALRRLAQQEATTRRFESPVEATRRAAAPS